MTISIVRLQALEVFQLMHDEQWALSLHILMVDRYRKVQRTCPYDTHILSLLDKRTSSTAQLRPTDHY